MKPCSSPSGCSDKTDAITDCALGKTPDAAFAAHLAACPLCANALRETRALAARVDDVLRRAAAVEPPLRAPERVMARICTQPRSFRWSGWAVVGSALAALLIAIVIYARRPPHAPPVAALSAWQSPTQALLRPPVAAAWTTTPRLGEGFFFTLKRSGELHAQ